jgi:hypothetical protein
MNKSNIRRHPKTQSERGAALFVVVMVITMLTGVGLFAARSTSLVDAATGYARQAAQAVALADYGAQLVASELGEGRAERVFQLMDLRNQFCPTYGNPAAWPPAWTTAGLTPQACYAYDYNQLEARVQTNTVKAANILEYQDATKDGSLGPKFIDSSNAYGVDGVLVVEIFDAFQISNIQGENAAKPSGREVTINSMAQIRPFSAENQRSQDNATWCSTNASAGNAASLLSVRSQLVVPSL